MWGSPLGSARAKGAEAGTKQDEGTREWLQEPGPLAAGGWLSTYGARTHSHPHPFTSCEPPQALPSQPFSFRYSSKLDAPSSDPRESAQLHAVVGSSQILSLCRADPGSENAKGRVGGEGPERAVSTPTTTRALALAATPADCSGLPGLRPRSPTAGKGKPSPLLQKAGRA